MKLPLILSWTAKKTYVFLQAHTRPQSDMLILCAASRHYSFLHLQLNSFSMFHPVLYVNPARPQPPCDVTNWQANRAPLAPCHQCCILSKQYLPWCCRSAVWSCRPSHPDFIVRSPVRRSLFGILMSTLALSSACFLRLVPSPSSGRLVFS